MTENLFQRNIFLSKRTIIYTFCVNKGIPLQQINNSFSFLRYK